MAGAPMAVVTSGMGLPSLGRPLHSEKGGELAK